MKRGLTKHLTTFMMPITQPQHTIALYTAL